VDAPLLQAEFLRELRVDPRTHPRGQAHLSAASGLAMAGRFLYIAADDEHHLGVLDLERADEPLLLHRVRPGNLPADKAARKRLKPDFESLLAVPPLRDAPHGALLTLGSGSTPRRQRGLLLALDPEGQLGPVVREFDLAPLYAPLRGRFGDLNIEGACIAEGCLRLLQRANTGTALNACIAYRLDEFTGWLQGGGATAPTATAITDMKLGTADGIPLGWTDATGLPSGGWIFSAVAEDTPDSYADGRCAAAALGWVSAAGDLQGMVWLAGAPKVEGVALHGASLLLVTDADDPARASQLLRLPWPLAAS
jgi:hypothetical protein